VAYTHEEYFTEVLLADPANPTDGVYTGDITLDLKDGAAFYWNATTNTKLTGAAAVTAAPAATDDYFKFDPASRSFRINGKIKINGSLTFSGGGDADTLNYLGRCAFLVSNDVNINVNLLSLNTVSPYSSFRSFPVNSCLGIMAMNDINLGTGPGASQLDLLGAFYAFRKITSAKQTDVMGTFVSTYFDIGKQVPNIFQVPSLAANLPLGMIGNYPISSMLRVSWRELGLG
jgi:hypothetical protein